MLQPVVRKTWAPQGQTPIEYSWGRHDRLSVISALTLAPYRHRIGLYFDIHRKNICTDDVFAFVLSVRRKLLRRIILILDRWSVHRGAVRCLLDSHADTVDVEWLPTYAPEINPVEQIWNHTKYADLANYIPDNLNDLCGEVEQSIIRMRYAPSLLRSFFKHAKLDL